VEEERKFGEKRNCKKNWTEWRCEDGRRQSTQDCLAKHQISEKKNSEFKIIIRKKSAHGKKSKTPMVARRDCRRRERSKGVHINIRHLGGQCSLGEGEQRDAFKQRTEAQDSAGETHCRGYRVLYRERRKIGPKFTGEDWTRKKRKSLT